MNNNGHGFTFVELIVVVAIVSGVSLGIMVILRHSIRETARITQALPLEREARDAINWVARDLQNASRNSLGNLLLDGGFELEKTVGATTWPYYWEQNSTPAGLVEFFHGTGAPLVVHSGVGSVQLLNVGTGASNPTRYRCRKALMAAQLHLMPGTDYLVTAWARQRTPTVPVANPTVRINLLRASNLSSVVTSTQFTPLLQWTQISYRFTYSDTNPVDALVELELDVQTNNVSMSVLFDDVAVTPVRSILATPFSASVETVTIDNSQDDLKPYAGYRFDRVERTPLPMSWRYRVDSNNVLLREELEAQESPFWHWAVTHARPLAKNVAQFSIDYMDCDTNGDGAVNAADKSGSPPLGTKEKDSLWKPEFDLNRDGTITQKDLDILASFADSATDPLRVNGKNNPLRIVLKVQGSLGRYKKGTTEEIQEYRLQDIVETLNP